MRESTLRAIALVGAILGATLAWGCGAGGNQTTSSESTTAAVRPPTEDRPANWTQLKRVAASPQRVLIPQGPPPKEVVVRDLKTGHGRQLKVGHSLTVKYMSFNYETGAQQEDHWNKEPFSWGFGPGRVVKGWVTGLNGMRVGERRELIVPSRLAYRSGARVYVIELLKVI